MRNPLSKNFLASAVFTALLAGCTLGPNHVRPTMEMPSQFIQSKQISHEPVSSSSYSAAVDENEFWRSLEDPYLTALVSHALIANHDLRIALSNYDKSQALLRGAKGDRWPTVTGNAGASESRLSADQAPGIAQNDRDNNQYEISAGFSWELDVFGRVRRQIEAGKADADASSADFRAMQIAIVSEVANDYLALRGLQEQLRVAQESSASQAETLRLVERGFAAGRGTEFDVLRARAQLETTQSRIPSLEASIAKTLHHLAVLTGQAPGKLAVDINSPRPLPAMPGVMDPGTPGDLLRRRPDVIAAEHRLHSATAKIGVAKADLFPRFTLGGLIGSQATYGNALFGRSSETGMVAFGIDWSFLNRNRVRARLAAANSDASADLARYEQTVLRALEETENALVQYGKARIEDQHLARAAADSSRAAEMARLRYQNGATSLLDVLDAERNKLQAEDSLAQGRTRSLAGWVSVYRAMAGGWPTKLPARIDIETSQNAR